MSKRRLVDTNLVVRYLVQDHEKHAKAAGKLFDAYLTALPPDTTALGLSWNLT